MGVWLSGAEEHPAGPGTHVTRASGEGVTFNQAPNLNLCLGLFGGKDFCLV